MKYLYSVLIILVAFFAIPPALDLSGQVIDHMRLSSKGQDADDAAPTRLDRRIQESDPKAIAKPTAVVIIKE